MAWTEQDGLMCQAGLLSAFGTCYEQGKTLQFVSFAMSMLSLLCWIVSGVPQIVTSIRQKKADDISTGFLVIWTVGDSLGLVGALLSANILMSQAMISAVYLALSVSLAAVCIYFKRKSGVRVHGKFLSVFYPVYAVILIACGIAGGLKLDTVGSVLGAIISWACGAVYISSRCVQITKTCKSKQAESVSKGLFILALLGNVTYVLQVVFYGGDKQYYIDQLPYLIGSGGIIPFDIFTTCYLTYLNRKAKKSQQIEA